MDENSYAFSITEDASNHYVLKIAGKRYNPNELGRILAGMELH